MLNIYNLYAYNQEHHYWSYLSFEYDGFTPPVRGGGSIII